MKTYPLPAYLQRFLPIVLQPSFMPSPNTVASYRDTFRLLLKYTADRIMRQPTQLQIADIDADLIGGFLTFVETVISKASSVRSAKRLDCFTHDANGTGGSHCLVVCPRLPRSQRFAATRFPRRG
jgi:hypothetical protein